MILLRKIIGESMIPSYKPGQIIIGLKFRKPRLGDIVIANFEDRQIIKRVAKISENKVFLLGDNLNKSKDSRFFGWLPKSCIKGVVLW